MKMDLVTFQITLLLGFGCATLTSASLQITSSGGDGVGFLQSSKAILTCTISPYTGSQTWKVNGVSVSDCGFVVCAENASNPDRFSFTPNISSGIFIFTINPVENADNGNDIDCFDGSNTETVTMVVTDPVVTATHTSGKQNVKKCISVVSNSGIIYMFGLSQAICLGCVVYYFRINLKYSYFERQVSDIFVIWFASVPVFGLFGIAYLVWKLYSKRQKRPCNSKVMFFFMCFHILIIIPIFRYLKFYWRYHGEGTFKILAIFMFLIYIFSFAPYGTPVLECWDIVTDKFSSDYTIIAFIVLQYLSVIWITLLVVLFCLQYLQTLEFKDIITNTRHECTTSTVVDFCANCKVCLCGNCAKNHLNHKLWNNRGNEKGLTCRQCKKKDTYLARDICMTSKKEFSSIYDLCVEKTLKWSKEDQEWTCDFCEEKGSFIASNICTNCKTAFCVSCRCSCVGIKKEWKCEHCKWKIQPSEGNVCLSCKTVICSDCSYLHFTQCFNSTLVWGNPEKGVCCGEKACDNAYNVMAENVCVKCNTHLCRNCSEEHSTKCYHKDSARNHLDCDKCKEARYIVVENWTCDSCLTNFYLHAGIERDIPRNNFDNNCQAYECPVIGYCNDCNRTVCYTCFTYCEQIEHSLVITDGKLPTSHIFLIACGCTLFFGIIAILILWCCNCAKSRRHNKVQSAVLTASTMSDHQDIDIQTTDAAESTVVELSDLAHKF